MAFGTALILNGPGITPGAEILDSGSDAVSTHVVQQGEKLLTSVILILLRKTSCQMPAGMPPPLFTGSLAAFSEFQPIPLAVLSCVNYISEHEWCVVDLTFLCE